MKEQQNSKVGQKQAKPVGQESRTRWKDKTVGQDNWTGQQGRTLGHVGQDNRPGEKDKKAGHDSS